MTDHRALSEYIDQRKRRGPQEVWCSCQEWGPFPYKDGYEAAKRALEFGKHLEAVGERNNQ